MSFSKYLNGANSEAVLIWDQLLISTQMIPITQHDFIAAIFSGGSNFDFALRNQQGFLLMARPYHTQTHTTRHSIGPSEYR
jgi:hypothetical protein